MIFKNCILLNILLTLQICGGNKIDETVTSRDVTSLADKILDGPSGRVAVK